MKSPAITMPGVREALLAIHKLTSACDVPRATMELVQVRIGQINGCSVCVDMHTRALRKLGESDARIFAIAVWREASYYTEPERAALALAEAATRLGDRPDPVPDDVWKTAAEHYPEPALAGLITAIAAANFWNRLNVTTRQVTGEWVAQYL
jgi:AhpD family alkylhydroperoxidase